MSEGVPITVRTPELIKGSAVANGIARKRTGTLWSYELRLVADAAGAAATVEVKVGQTESCQLLFGTLSATVSSTPDADGKYRGNDSINGTAPWANHVANITAISGTGTVATVIGGGL